MNIFRQLNERSLGHQVHSSRINVSFALDKLQAHFVELPDDYQLNDESNVNPPLGAALKNNHLAICSERGNVYIYDASSSDNLIESFNFQPHYNAVFDIKWRPGHENQLATVSGDQSFALWDFNHFRVSQDDVQNENGHVQEPVYRKKRAHLSSIKSISFKDSNIFSTCSRDGNIHIWDIRTPLGDNDEPCMTIPDAHYAGEYVKRKDGSITPKVTRRRPAVVSTVRSKPTSSTTCVLFQPEMPFLYSSGANDGLIKLWDIRKLPSNNVKQQQLNKFGQKKKKMKVNNCFNGPLQEFSSSSTSNQGFSCLELDSKGRIYGSCTDHKIYCFNPRSTSTTCDGDENKGQSCNLLGSFKGHRSNNFTKIKILNDYLISGSIDNYGYIWNIKDTIDTSTNCGSSFGDATRDAKVKKRKRCPNNEFKPIITLKHDDEVTAIDANHTNYDIFCCSDDQKITKWSLNGKIMKSSSETVEGIKSINVAEKYFDEEEDDDVEIEWESQSINNVSTSKPKNKNGSISNYLLSTRRVKELQISSQ